MNNKEYINLYSTYAMLCYFQHNIAYSAYCSAYVSFLLLPISNTYNYQYLLLSSTTHTRLVLMVYRLLGIFQLVTDGYPLPCSDEFGKMSVQIPVGK